MSRQSFGNSSTATHQEKVYPLLLATYQARGFNWNYRDLFASLVGCSPHSPFARNAEFYMRIEFPAFQHRGAFFSGRSLDRSAVKRQAIAIAAMLDRGNRETWSKLEVPDACGRPVAIYGLLDPGDGLFHYVGLTVDLTTRFEAHCTWCLSEERPKDAWLRPLIVAGKRARLKVLAWVPPRDQYESERYWIQKLRNEGQPLTNSTCY